MDSDALGDETMTDLVLMKRRARSRVGIAISAGKITRGTCERCGSRRTQAQHDNYTKPFSVRWFCKRHHIALHYPNPKRYRLTVELYKNERTIFRQAAERRGVTVAMMVRQLVLEEHAKYAQGKP